jgi:hypothetical protein
LGTMSYPQQPPNDPQQYQQPGYPQRPPAPAPGTPQMNVDLSALTAPENRAYLIAGIGGLVAFLGYFILPYWSWSYHFGTGASAVSNSGSDTGSAFGSWLSLSMLGGLVALVVAGLMALGISAIPQLTPQLASRILLGSGVASALGLVIFLFQYSSDTSGTGFLSSVAGLSFGLSFGFFLAVLATIAMLVGGVMQMQRT